MSQICFGNACAVIAQSDLEARQREEERKREREEIRSALRLRKQASSFREDKKARERYIPLDDTIIALSVLSGYEINYEPTTSGKTRIEATFDIVEGQLEQLLKVLPRGKYLEFRNALLYLHREASSVCDMIHNHENPNERYTWGSKRIENFVSSYNTKIKGNYLRT